jgi:hypothetical protein
MKEIAVFTLIERKTNIQTQSSRTTIRNLAIFTVVVLASGWIGRGVDLLMGNTGYDTLGLLLWIATPLSCSMLLRAFAGAGWRDFGIKPNFKGNSVWYLFAILVYPVVTALILIIGGGSGLITFPNLTLNTLGLMLGAFAVGLPFQLIKDFFEEGAWRGFLAPKIYSLRLNDFVAHTLVGLIWGAFHIPYYLFFLDPAVLQQFTTLDLAIYIPLTFVVFIAWAFVYGEIRMLTNSVWPAILMHAIEDAFLFSLFTGQLIQLVPGTDWLISPMNGLINVLFFVMLGIGLRQLRKRKIAVA